MGPTLREAVQNPPIVVARSANSGASGLNRRLDLGRRDVAGRGVVGPELAQFRGDRRTDVDRVGAAPAEATALARIDDPRWLADVGGGQARDRCPRIRNR